MPTWAAVFAGRASALFAVLAGCSLVLSTRSRLAVSGRLRDAAPSVLIRAAAIVLIGLCLGSISEAAGGHPRQLRRSCSRSPCSSCGCGPSALFVDRRGLDGPLPDRVDDGCAPTFLLEPELPADGLLRPGDAGDDAH
jgi:hypothetical protein